MQRRIDAFLDQADAASDAGDWNAVAEKAAAVLAIDPGNEDAKSFLQMARAALAESQSAGGEAALPAPIPLAKPLPVSFGAGRYRVSRLLGEGGRKQVYLARDSSLDRDVAVAVLRTEGLDATGRERVAREARAMARMGNHPHLVAIHDIGDDDGTPFLVEEFMTGGDLAGLHADGPISVERVLAVGRDISRALAFMHRAGVVHRDLKPANVFLAADGSVKLGDFGLAMTGDLARLTQHGMLVGTVAYMAPEQALGHPPTPAADLYALGAVLYEMVTGQPPFAGDAAAILTQHLNTPPVAPSVHAPACPPSLEKLILQLLAKEPSGRPGSADEVLSALEAIDPSEQVGPRVEVSPLERLRRGVFVGREQELERLRASLDAMLVGEGSVVLLVGEPGIGKTATARELESYARIRGAQVHWGFAHESSGAPAFWPWIQAGRSWGTAGNDVPGLRAGLGADAAELTRLFPELADLGFGSAPPVDDGPSAQFRLFTAFTNLVRAMANRSPLVLVLDDLHWADRPTLLLLQHVARELPRMRVLIVGTYRDTDLARTHPLSETLAALNRESAPMRVSLRGLTLPETRDYIEAATRVHPAPDVLRRIFDETEGNPFFLSQVVNLMAEEGTISRDSVSDIRLPEGVREALGRRLDRLSDEANDLLKTAAVAGREFAYETLSIVSGHDDDALLRLIEEGLAARVIEETSRPGHYRFTHALMQETLLEELSTTRRVRLHGQVGEALERRWGGRAEQNAARLSGHFLESATLTEAHAAKALHYSSLAGAAAYEQAAFAESERHYAAALSLREGQEVDHDMAVLLLGLSKAEVAQFKTRPAWRALRRALETLVATGDSARIAECAVIAGGGEFMSPNQPVVVERALSALPGRTREAALISAYLALARAGGSGDLAGAKQALFQSAEWLREHPDDEIQALAELVRVSLAVDEGKTSEALATMTRLLSLEAHLPPNRRSTLHFMVARSHMTWIGAGFEPDLDAAQRHITSCQELARRSGRSLDVVYGAIVGAMLAVARGEFETARQLVAEGLAEYADYGDLVAISALAAAESGDSVAQDEALSSVRRIAERPMTAAGSAGAYGVSAIASILVAGSAVDESLAAAVLAAVDQVTEQMSSWWRGLHAVALGIISGIRPGLVAPAEALTRLEANPVVEGFLLDGCRARGMALAALGELAEAIVQYRISLRWSSHGLVTIHARTAYELAGLLLRTGDPADAAEARSLLTSALDTARRTGMRPLTEQISRRLVDSTGVSISPASTIDAVTTAVSRDRPNLSRQAAPDGTVTLLFSDIEGSTALNVELGDHAWMDLLALHNRLVRNAIRAHHGFEVKTEGDAFMVAFAAASDALRCAVAVQRALARHSETASHPLRVRIGLHTGEPIRQGDDFFGTHVVLAARIAAHATGNEILVSSALREMVAPGREFTLAERPPVTLKGLPGEHVVYAVDWA